MLQTYKTIKKSTALLLCTLLLSASCVAIAQESTYKTHDPFEKVNRVTYSFNNKVDKYALKPVAKVYKFITPWPVRKGVTNFFSNLGEIPTMVNDGLQLEVRYALTDFWRLVLNTTVGVGGVFDIATDAGLEKRYNDFGITLAKYGIKEAPYIVIPFIGPSTLRDGAALWVDYSFFTVWPYITNMSLRNSAFALDVVSLRASLLEGEDIMDQAALDEYVFVRDIYLQKRTSLINSNGTFASADGSIPATSQEQQDELDFALGGNDE